MRIIISAIFFVVGILLFSLRRIQHDRAMLCWRSHTPFYIALWPPRPQLIAIMLAVFVPTLIGLEIPFFAPRAPMLRIRQITLLC